MFIILLKFLSLKVFQIHLFWNTYFMFECFKLHEILFVFIMFMFYEVFFNKNDNIAEMLLMWKRSVDEVVKCE